MAATLQTLSNLSWYVARHYELAACGPAAAADAENYRLYAMSAFELLPEAIREAARKGERHDE